MKHVKICHSTPIEVLHELAKLYKPKIPKYDNAYWVAILIHTIQNTSRITETSSFMWVKTHGKITVKTLKAQYFSRFPLDIVLKQGCRRLNDKFLVRDLAKCNPLKDDLIVLRALDEDQAEEEQYKEEEEDLKKHVHKEVITIDSDHEGDSAEILPSNLQNRNSAQSIVRHHQHVNGSDLSTTPLSQARLPTPPDTDSEKVGALAPMPFVIDNDEAQDHSGPECALMEEEPLVFRDLKNAELADSAAEVSEDNEEAEEDHEVEYPLSHSASGQLNSLGLILRIEALPEFARDLAWRSNDQICEACQMPTTMREWTHFGPKYGALCTDCTKLWLHHNHDFEGLVLVERMLEEEYVRKRLSQDQGHHQSLNENVPFVNPEGADEEISEFFVLDLLQADAMQAYKNEVMIDKDEALFNEWMRNSSSRSQTPAMFEDASEEFPDSANVMTASNDQPGPDCDVFLAEDDEDTLAAENMDNGQSSLQYEQVQVPASPKKDGEDASGFDPEDWTTPLKVTKKRKRANDDDDEDYNAGDENDGEDD